MSIWSRRRGEEGFTLIELAVALGLFGLVLVSLSLLFDRALETTRRVQTDQIGKNLAQRKLEEIRFLPFYVSQKTNAKDVDMLDRYFPGTTNLNPPNHPAGPTVTGTYDATAGVYTYTSTDSVVDSGVTFTRAASLQFVAIMDDGSLVVRPPVDGYDSNNADFDSPGADYVKVAVTVSFTAVGRARSVTLDTVVSRTRREEPKVEAAASITGAQISGVTFHDGDAFPSVAADILAQVGLANLTFREVAEPSAQASADPVEVVERDPNTNTPVQPEAPADGEASATAPNSTDGPSQVTSASVTCAAPQGPCSMQTVNPSPVSPVVISSWGPSNPSAASEARVSFQHSQNPESKATVSTSDFLLNARDTAELAPHAVIEIAGTTGSVEQTSTTSQATSTASVTLQGLTVWASTIFGTDPDYVGTVLIGKVTVYVESWASTTDADTHVHWRVDNLRVWDPDMDMGGGEFGGYLGPWTFGFDHDCGGWVDDPALCGPNRTDGKQPFENPNPVVIPAVYQGVDGNGDPASSLVIVTGATVQDESADASKGVASSSAAQQNVLSLSTRDDIAGAAILEPMLAGVGAANTNVSYVAHQH